MHDKASCQNTVWPRIQVDVHVDHTTLLATVHEHCVDITWLYTIRRFYNMGNINGCDNV